MFGGAPRPETIVTLPLSGRRRRVVIPLKAEVKSRDRLFRRAGKVGRFGGRQCQKHERPDTRLMPRSIETFENPDIKDEFFGGRG